eukprot:1258202-Amphidinium_carterae.1
MLSQDRRGSPKSEPKRRNPSEIFAAMVKRGVDKDMVSRDAGHLCRRHFLRLAFGAILWKGTCDCTGPQ